jgi:hypothetical protein
LTSYGADAVWLPTSTLSEPDAACGSTLLHSRAPLINGSFSGPTERKTHRLTERANPKLEEGYVRAPEPYAESRARKEIPKTDSDASAC